MFESRMPGLARNEALAGYLVRVGWSAENLGHHLNQLAVSLRLPDRLHVKTPRRWIEAIGPKTRPSVPRDPWPGLVCTALSRRLREPVTLADLGWQMPHRAVFVPADDGLELSWDALGALASLREAVEADGMDRRRYYYLATSARVDGQPRIVEQTYLGTAEEIAAAMTGATRMPSRSRHLAFGDLAAALERDPDTGREPDH